MPAASDPGTGTGVARRWSAIAAATRCRRARVPFVIDGVRVGSVATAHLPALRRWPSRLEISATAVQLHAAESERDAVLAELNLGLRACGLIRAWRDETFAIPDPSSLRPLACIERAAARFWGTLTFGAHATGWVADAAGRPAGVWIAQRAFDKATDPGAFDNLVGGGVPLGQSPFETLVREGWEEAGLDAERMRCAVPGRVIRLRREVAEGLQFEWIHSFDLALPSGERPVNQDGEVHAFTLQPVDQALDLAAGGTMTADAALVTLDFALRRGLLPAAEHAALQARSASLWVTPPEPGG